jgi:hypothetical protein
MIHLDHVITGHIHLFHGVLLVVVQWALNNNKLGVFKKHP